MNPGPQVLVVEARFYDDISTHLAEGVIRELDKGGVQRRHIVVPGILEIPAVLRYAVRSMELRASDARFAGYVVLGCAIKGETDHYEHVSREAIGGVQSIALQYSLAVGNGILTCRTYDQALVRARTDGRDFGGQAARACLKMMSIKRSFGL